MSGRKPLNEGPISEQAVSTALVNIFGSRKTDENRYLSYQQNVAERQPSYWSQIQRLGEFCERSSRLVEFPAELQMHAVIGGGLIYLASAEEQAAMERRYVPPINFLKAEKAFASLAIVDSETLEDVEEMGVAFGEVLSDDEKALVLDTGFADRLAVFKSMSPDRQAAFDPATDLAEKAKRAASQMLRGLTSGSVNFLRKEPNFVKVMNEWWWKDIDPHASTGQLIGATLTRQMIWPPR